MINRCLFSSPPLIFLLSECVFRSPVSPRKGASGSPPARSFGPLFSRVPPFLLRRRRKRSPSNREIQMIAKRLPLPFSLSPLPRLLFFFFPEGRGRPGERTGPSGSTVPPRDLTRLRILFSGTSEPASFPTAKGRTFSPRPFRLMPWFLVISLADFFSPRAHLTPSGLSVSRSSVSIDEIFPSILSRTRPTGLSPPRLRDQASECFSHSSKPFPFDTGFLLVGDPFRRERVVFPSGG